MTSCIQRLSREICAVLPDGTSIPAIVITTIKPGFDSAQINQVVYNMSGEIVVDAIVPSACDGDGIVSSSDSSPNNLVYLSTGDEITEVETVRDASTGAFLYYTYHYFNTTTGVMEMTNNAQSVGMNAGPIVAAVMLTQLVGEIKLEYFDPAADITKTVADLVADAVADGVILSSFKADGTLYQRPATIADYIAKIDIDLKPIYGGAGALGETEGQATTSEASVTDGLDEQNIDGGGSRTYGALATDPRGFYRMPQFARDGSLNIAAGSVVEVTIVLASNPIDEALLATAPAPMGTVTVIDFNPSDIGGDATLGNLSWNHVDASSNPTDAAALTYTITRLDASGGAAIAGAAVITVTPSSAGTGPFNQDPVDFTTWDINSDNFAADFFFRMDASDGATTEYQFIA